MPRHEYLSVGTLNADYIQSPAWVGGLPYLGFGTRFFVSSGVGSDTSGSGKTESRPFATLDYALGKCTASKEDQVILLPGHAETITGAGGITLDKIGAKIIGLGQYSLKPTFLMDGANTVTCLVTHANIRLSNCIFKAGHSDIATFATVTGKGFQMDNCQFLLNTTDENFVTIVTAGVADNDYDGLALIDNVIDMLADNGTLTPISLVKDSRDVKIQGNKIYALLDTTPYAAIYSPNTEVHLAIDISYNHIHNTHNANAVVGISVGSTGSTGLMHHNYVYALDVAGATPFVSAATGISLFDNYYNHVGSTSSAYLHPAVGSLA